MKPLLTLLSAVLLSSCALTPGGSSSQARYFFREVKPVLQQNCVVCHNGALPPPAINLRHREAAFRKLPNGKAYIVPGKPDESLLITAVSRMGTHPKMMPRTEVSLTDDQIGMLREWIEDGAYWPECREGVLKPQQKD
jgi:hypothetical protein